MQAADDTKESADINAVKRRIVELRKFKEIYCHYESEKYTKVKLAEFFGVSRSTLWNYLKEIDELEDLEKTL